MSKLQNAAFEIYVRGHGINYSEEYAKFENLLSCVDDLGRCLFLEDPHGTLMELQRKGGIKRNIKNVVAALHDLANQHELSLEELVSEVTSR